MAYNSQKMRKMVQMALLVAITVILTYIPLKVGAIEMTFRMIPVVIGGILLGPVEGAILGGFFGLTSLFECLGLFGMPLSAFGAFIIDLNPLFTVIMCFVPRILMGLFASLIFRGLRRIDKTNFISYLIANISGAVLNTVLFMGALILLFWSNPDFIAQMNSWGLGTDSLGIFLIAFVGINGVVEALVCAFLGTAVSKGVHVALKKLGR